MYGVDVAASLFDKDVNKEWHLKKLPSILTLLKTDYNLKAEGVLEPYLYLGSPKSFFLPHTEDADLYAINFNHFGAPKFWYTMKPSDAKRFERAAAASCHTLYPNCTG